MIGTHWITFEPDTPGTADLILRGWLLRGQRVRSSADLTAWLWYLRCDVIMMESVRRVKRRVLIANLIGDALRVFLLAAQAANLLLLVMVLTKLAPPWPWMQFGLANLVVLSCLLDFSWWKWLWRKVIVPYD